MENTGADGLLVVAGIIRKDGRILIAQRKEDCRREPCKWEFPGGKVEDGESPEKALGREIMEELGIAIRVVGAPYTETRIESGGITIRLVAYLADWAGGEPKAIDCKDFRWVGIGELRSFEWAAADLPIVERLCAGP